MHRPVTLDTTYQQKSVKSAMFILQLYMLWTDRVFTWNILGPWNISLCILWSISFGPICEFYIIILTFYFQKGLGNSVSNNFLNRNSAKILRVNTWEKLIFKTLIRLKGIPGTTEEISWLRTLVQIIRRKFTV